MIVKLFSVACSIVCLLLAVHPVAMAQVFDPPLDDKTAKINGVVTAQNSEKEAADSSGIKQTSWYSLPMPKITMPKIEMPQFSMPSFWTSKDGASTDNTSMFAPITSGAKKISDGSKKAWEGAKDMFDFGRGESNQKAVSKKGPSFWDRLFVDKEPEGPRTVAEWMAQPRLDL
ncbi:MAG: hypothetical protein ABGX16_23710 [Pirellulales bacterium]